MELAEQVELVPGSRTHIHSLTVEYLPLSVTWNSCLHGNAADANLTHLTVSATQEAKQQENRHLSYNILKRIMK